MADDQAAPGYIKDRRRDISGSQGVLAGDYGTQVNQYTIVNQTGRPAPPTAVTVGDVPWEPASFQPRARLMDALERQLEGPRNRVVFAVTGQLGSGKSQVAAAYARRRMAEQWRLVAWVDASDETTLLSGLAQVATETRLWEPGAEARALAGRVRNLLQTDGDRRLLVFDNADRLDLLRPFLPQTGQAQVIVTSTRRAVTDLGVPVRVAEFSEAEALAFLVDRTGLEDTAGALAVAEELGFLPLGLAQAAALIKQENLRDYRVYLDRLRSLPIRSYLRPVEGDPYRHRLADAVELSLQAVENRDPSGLCGRLMGLIAVLAETGAARRLLQQAAGTGALPDRTLWPAAEVDHCLGMLADASLVGFAGNEDRDLVAAHRLVMRVVRERHAETGDLAAVTDGAVRALQASASTIGDAWADPDGVRDLAAGVSAVTKRRTDHPAAFTGEMSGELLRVRLRSACLLNQLGDSTDLVIEAARPLAGDCERVLGPGHPDTLMAQNNLALGFQKAGRPAEATPILQKALTGFTNVLGDDHRDTMTVRSNLALAYQATGHVDQAIPLLRQVLTDRERVLGRDFPDTQGSRNNLATAYQEAERPEEAIPLLEQAYAGYTRALGPEHPNTLTARSNLAMAFRKAGDEDQAIPLFEEILADSERTLPKKHPDIPASRFNLAMAYHAAGRTDEAISLLERALDGFEKSLPKDHPSTLMARRNLDIMWQRW